MTLIFFIDISVYAQNWRNQYWIESIRISGHSYDTKFVLCETPGPLENLAWYDFGMRIAIKGSDWDDVNYNDIDSRIWNMLRAATSRSKVGLFEVYAFNI